MFDASCCEANAVNHPTKHQKGTSSQITIHHAEGNTSQIIIPSHHPSQLIPMIKPLGDSSYGLSLIILHHLLRDFTSANPAWVLQVSVWKQAVANHLTTPKQGKNGKHETSLQVSESKHHLIPKSSSKMSKIIPEIIQHHLKSYQKSSKHLQKHLTSSQIYPKIIQPSPGLQGFPSPSKLFKAPTASFPAFPVAHSFATARILANSMMAVMTSAGDPATDTESIWIEFRCV